MTKEQENELSELKQIMNGIKYAVNNGQMIDKARFDSIVKYYTE